MKQIYKTEPFEYIHATNKTSIANTIMYILLTIASIIVVYYGLSLIKVMS